MSNDVVMAKANRTDDEINDEARRIVRDLAYGMLVPGFDPLRQDPLYRVTVNAATWKLAADETLLRAVLLMWSALVGQLCQESAAGTVTDRKTDDEFRAAQAEQAEFEENHPDVIAEMCRSTIDGRLDRIRFEHTPNTDLN